MTTDTTPETSQSIYDTLFSDNLSKPLDGHYIYDCVPCIPRGYNIFYRTIDQETPPSFYRHPRPLHNASTPAAPPRLAPCLLESNPERRTRVIPPQHTKKPGKNMPSLEQMPLFAQFASCDTPEKIVQFSNIYGRLTRDKVLFSNGDGTYDPVPGEPLSLWQEQRKKINDTLRFWRAYDENDKAFLQNNIDFIDAEIPVQRKIKFTYARLETDNRSAYAEFSLDGRFPFNQSTWGDHAAAARILVGLNISNALNEHPAKSSLVLTSGDKFSIVISSGSTLPKIWLSFAEVLAGQRFIRPCQVCGNLIELPEPTSKQLSHAKCAANDYSKKSQKRERYTSLLEAGYSIEETAASKGVRVTPETLRRWIKTDQETKMNKKKWGD